MHLRFRKSSSQSHRPYHCADNKSEQPDDSRIYIYYLLTGFLESISTALDRTPILGNNCKRLRTTFHKNPHSDPTACYE